MWRWEEMRKRFSRSYNISPPDWKPPSWKPAQVEECLDTMRAYVENDVEAAIRWYYAKKPWKAWASQLLKFLTLLATGLGGLLPIVSATGFLTPASVAADRRQLWNLQVNQIGY